MKKPEFVGAIGERKTGQDKMRGKSVRSAPVGKGQKNKVGLGQLDCMAKKRRGEECDYE